MITLAAGLNGHFGRTKAGGQKCEIEVVLAACANPLITLAAGLNGHSGQARAVKEKRREMERGSRTGVCL
jgi:hypothetical protein